MKIIINCFKSLKHILRSGMRETKYYRDVVVVVVSLVVDDGGGRDLDLQTSLFAEHEYI